MSTFTQIVEGIAANLASIDGLNEQAFMQTSPTLPAVDIVPAGGEYDKTFQRGRDSITFTVRVMVGTGLDEGAWRQMYAFLDPYGDTSIKQAVESDSTLGGAALDLRVREWREPRLFERGSTPALGCEWVVEVWIEGAAG